MPNIGFTGSQTEPTPKQCQTLLELLETLFTSGYTRMNNGDCIGSDAKAFELFRSFPGSYIVGHIPSKSEKRAFCQFDEENKPLPYLARNRTIIRDSDILVACPAQKNEKMRGSGTWHTIREARKKGIPIFMVFPDGSSRSELFTVGK